MSKNKKNKKNKENKEKNMENKVEEITKDEIKDIKEIKKENVIKEEQKEENIYEEKENIAVYGKNKKDNDFFFLKEIINFKNKKENKDKTIAIVDEDFFYMPKFNVEETLDYVLELLFVNFGKIVDDVDDVIDFMGLDNVRKTRLAKLSKYTLRMINIASNVILKPDIMFVYDDIELSLNEREEEIKMLRNLSKKYNFKLIYLSMNKDEILENEKIIEVK